MQAFRVRNDRQLSNRSGSIFLTIFFAIFTLFGTVITVFLAKEVFRGIETRNWQESLCTISFSEVAQGSGDTPYSLKVRYFYRFNGRRYEGGRYKRSKENYDKYSKARNLVDSYPPGSTVSCYVNPQNPAQAVLKQNSLWYALIIFFPLIFVAIGLGGLYAVFRGKFGTRKGGAISNRAKRQDRASQTSTSSPKETRRIMTILCLIFILVGSIFGYILVYRPISQYLAAKEWSTTACQVISSTVRKHDSSSSDSGPTYSIDILYSFFVNGREYRSNRYSFMDYSSSAYNSKSEVVKQYPRGKSFSCYYNPLNPGEAVIKRKLGWGMLLALVPVVLIFGGFAGLYFIFKKKKQVPAYQADFTRASKAKGLGSVFSTADASDSTYKQQGNVIYLQPKMSRGLKLLAMLAFCIIWNGVITVLIADVLASHRMGKPDWPTTLFAIPFVLVGIGSIVGVIYFLLAFFNPKVSLSLSPAKLRLGDSFKLSWQITGSTDRIKEFSLTLLGQEEATYTRGTNRHTDREVFYEEKLIVSSNSLAIKRGSVEAHVPQSTMHSFVARSNRIVWMIKVHGVIDKWPDVVNSYTIQVHPKGV